MRKRNRLKCWKDRVPVNYQPVFFWPKKKWIMRERKAQFLFINRVKLKRLKAFRYLWDWRSNCGKKRKWKYDAAWIASALCRGMMTLNHCALRAVCGGDALYCKCVVLNELRYHVWIGSHSKMIGCDVAVCIRGMVKKTSHWIWSIGTCWRELKCVIFYACDM